MKAVAALVLILLASACDSGPRAEDGKEAPSKLPDSHVLCATGTMQRMEAACDLEIQQGADGTVLVIRAPDGGFRRLLVTKDGRGVSAADGAEPAIVTPLGDRLIEVSIGGDRYRLPATVAR